jgi:hypothetical protein
LSLWLLCLFRTFLIRIPGPIICNCSLPLTRLLVFRQSNAMSSYLLSQYVTEQLPANQPRCFYTGRDGQPLVSQINRRQSIF